MAEGGWPERRRSEDERGDRAATSAPSDIELLNLSLEIIRSWKYLGIRLGLNKDVLEDIDTNTVQYPSPRQKALAMLCEWRNRMPDSFSYIALSKALLQEGLFEVEHKYCGCQKSAVVYHGRQEQEHAPASQEKSQTRGGSTTRWNLSGFWSSLIQKLHLKTVKGHQEATTSQPTTSREDPLVKEAAAFLKEQYKTREADINPLPWNEDWQLSLDKIYTRLQMVSKERERSYNRTEDPCDMHKIFKSHKECRKEKPRVVLVEGKPGIGKTTFTQKLTYDWSRGKIEASESFPDIEILVKLKCRDLKHEERSPAVADILNKAITDLLPRDRPDLRNALFRYINEENSSVLMLLDGLDELPQEIDLYPLIRGEILSNLHLLLTSRDNPKLRKHCDSLFQILGFTLEDAKSYILKFFKKNPENGQALLERIEAKNQDGALLRELIRSPLNTALLCAVCQETNGQLPSHTTQLYQKIIWCILKIYYNKKAKDPPVDLVATHEEDLAALGRLALQGVQNDRLHFDEDDLLAKDRATKILDYGFLSKQTSTSILNPRSSYQFLHKTLQEFFAALYFQVHLLSGNEACLEYLSEPTSDKYVHKYHQVMIFLIGLLSQNAEAGEICVRVVSSVTRSIAANTDIDSSFLYICDVIRENISVDLENDLQAAVVSSFTWEGLDLMGMRLDENSIEYRLVCQAVKRNYPLKWLRLDSNEIKDVSLLAHSILRNSTLKYLFLCYNPLLLAGVPALAKVLYNNKTLQELVLDEKWRNEPTVLELKQHNPRLYIGYY